MLRIALATATSPVRTSDHASEPGAGVALNSPPRKGTGSSSSASLSAVWADSGLKRGGGVAVPGSRAWTLLGMLMAMRLGCGDVRMGMNWPSRGALASATAEKGAGDTLVFAGLPTEE